AAMDQALATSGTVGLELAVAGVPHVIAYKMNPLTWAIVRGKLTVKYAHLANLLLDRGAVPEFIQDAARADALDSALSSLDRADQKQAFDEIRRLLAGETTQTPATQAATFVLKEK
ncbi:MAG: lipid-A-disaccharide synthase, partial [Alphaproteobacteria bacterium]|nr:lipid-A-disaccharide synthase [Alphaproteobacteria bacterium]